MRNIVNLQLEPRITGALRGKSCFAQEPISTCSATKRMVKFFGHLVWESRSFSHYQGELLSPTSLRQREATLSAAQIWAAFQWHIRWLETTACILWTKGRYEAIPWQALPYPAQTKSRINERNQTAVRHWSVGVATIITMGVANIYHTQKG